MRTILSEKILKFIESEGISYQCDEQLLQEYVIASIFNPVEKGLYYFLGEHIPNSISKSLLILEKGNYINLNNENVGLYINQNPQLFYYKLLSSLYTNYSNGVISNLAIIDMEAIIGKNVQIDPFSVIGKVVIGDNTIVRSHCYIHDNTFIGNNVVIENQSTIGVQGVAWIWNKEETKKIIQPQLGGVEIKNNVFLGANTIIVRGSLNENSIVGENTLFAPGCRLGHGTQIGSYVHLANNIITGGNTKIGSNCFIGSAAVFKSKVKIHSDTIVGAGAVVVKNTTEKGKTLVGIPAVERLSKRNPSGMPKPKSIN